jgi:nucleoporin POM152
VKHDKNPRRTITKTFNSQRAEIVLKPEQSGTYTYTFSHLTDKYYSRVPLEGSPSTTQRVHPLAVAQFVGGPNGVTVSNCEGRFIDLELDLRVRLSTDVLSSAPLISYCFSKGSPPFTVEMQLVGPKGSEVKTFPTIQNNRAKVHVPILEDLDRTGGVMEIDLGSWWLPIF